MAEWFTKVKKVYAVVRMLHNPPEVVDSETLGGRLYHWSAQVRANLVSGRKS